MSTLSTPLKDLAHSFFAVARDIVLSGEQHQPIIFAHTHLLDGEWMGVALDFSTDETKRRSMQKARTICAIYGVDRLVFVTEAWTLAIDKDDPAAKEYLEGRKRPSLSPDRKEVLNVLVVDRTHELMAHAPLGYKDGRRTIGELEFLEGGPVTGMMTGLLPPAGVGFIEDADVREALCEELGLTKIEITPPTPVRH